MEMTAFELNLRKGSELCSKSDVGENPFQQQFGSALDMLKNLVQKYKNYLSDNKNDIPKFIFISKYDFI